MITPSSPELNYVTVAGVRSPGRAQFTGIAAPHNWQVQEGYALSGASVIYRGRGIAKPVLTIAMWTDAHLKVEWPLFKKAMSPPTIGKPYFVDMAHPLLSAADIKAVGVEELGEPVRTPGGGLWLATIKLIEYRPFKLALVKPDKSIPAVEKGKPIPPKTALEQKLVDEAKWLSDRMTDGRTRK